MVCADTDHQATKSHSKWWWAAAKLDGDLGFHCTTRDGARLLSAAGNPAYLYSFEPAGFPSEVIGHCSEKSFLLDSVWPAMPAPLIELGEAMGRSWVAFVSHPLLSCALAAMTSSLHLTANERRCRPRRERRTRRARRRGRGTPKRRIGTWFGLRRAATRAAACERRAATFGTDKDTRRPSENFWVA